MSLDKYDAGILPSNQTATVEWWQDYVRVELDRAHSFYEGIHINLINILSSVIGYVESNHDEGCELDPEFGETNLRLREDELFDEDEDASPLEWPRDATCTCGTTDFVNQLKSITGG
jgi:hypothetical protein